MTNSGWQLVVHGVGETAKVLCAHLSKTALSHICLKHVNIINLVAELQRDEKFTATRIETGINRQHLQHVVREYSTAIATE